jgi:hypothetical protein
MVNTTIDGIDRGEFQGDLNYLIEGNTLGSHSNPYRDTNFVAIPVFNLVTDHPGTKCSIHTTRKSSTAMILTNSRRFNRGGHGVWMSAAPHNLVKRSLICAISP